MTTSSTLPEPTVLLNFRAENVRSFRDSVEFSMLATGLAERDATWDIPWREGGRTVRVLPTAGIFGANASGKTAILQAMDDMRGHVMNSFRHGDPNGGIPRRPFRLDDAATKPSRFEVDVVLGGVRHEYGFVIDNDHVLEEWAYSYTHGKAALLFSRDGNAIDFGPPARQKGRAVAELLRPNALFLSTAAAANHPSLMQLYNWFTKNLILAEASTRHLGQAFTTSLLDNPEFSEGVLEMLRVADLGVSGAIKHEVDPQIRERMRRAVRILAGQEGDTDVSDADLDFEHLDLRLTHRGATGDVEMHASDESLGTLVWFGLVGPVIQALANGSTILVDELDASLHPSLVAHLVRMFQRTESNPHHAQLVFNSHDVTLLGDAVSDRLIGRDQIWFTEKVNDGSTRLYPLSDLKPRKEESVGRRYLAGRYGATPILSTGDFDALAELITSGDAR